MLPVIHATITGSQWPSWLALAGLGSNHWLSPMCGFLLWPKWAITLTILHQP